MRRQLRIYIGSDDGDAGDNRNVKIRNSLFPFKGHDKILFTSDAVGVSRGTVTAYTAASDVVKNYKVNKTAVVHKPQRIRLPRSINCLPKPRGHATEYKTSWRSIQLVASCDLSIGRYTKS